MIAKKKTKNLCDKKMKFQKYGKKIPEALEIVIEIQPLDFAMKSSFKRLNYLLGMVKKKKQSIFLEYIRNLGLKYESLVKEDFVSNREDHNINEFLTKFEILKDHPKLVKNYLNYFLQILHILDKDNWLKEKVKVINRNHIRSFLLPKYYNLLTLTETINRDEAISLYKLYVTQYIKDNAAPNRKIFDKLKDFKKYFEKDKEEITIGWYGFLSDVNDGKFCFRKDNCLWADILTDLPDVMLKYLVCCYGDFQAAVTRSNDNFILTMKHTIIEGDPYCDCIIHDTNIDWDLTHPPKEFWDNLNSIE